MSQRLGSFEFHSRSAESEVQRFVSINSRNFRGMLSVERKSCIFCVQSRTSIQHFHMRVYACGKREKDTNITTLDIGGLPGLFNDKLKLIIINPIIDA